MGTSRGVGEFADKMGKLAKGVVDQNKPGVVAAATVYKTSLVAEGKRDSGGDGVLSNFGKNGAKLSAGYDLKSTGGKAQAIVKPRPMGPWKVLEYGAKPHPIIPGLTRRQQRAMALFSFMAGGRGEFDVGAIAGMARGNRNNRGGSRRRQRSLFLAGPFGDKRKQGASWVNHPGVKNPPQTWSRAIKRSQKGAMSAYRNEQVRQMTKVLGS